MHIDALAVTVINDHKTAHKYSSFAPFQAYHNRKEVFSFSGYCSLIPDQGFCPWTPLGAQPSNPRYRLVLCTRHMNVYDPPISTLGSAPALSRFGRGRGAYPYRTGGHVPQIFMKGVRPC